MKSSIRISLFAAGLIFSALPAHALPKFIDAFNTTQLNSNWKPFAENGGKLILNNGRLHLVTAKAIPDSASGWVVLRAPQASVNESWETQVVVSNNTQSGEAWTGLLVGNANSIYDNNVSIELSQFDGQRRIKSFSAAAGIEKKRLRDILTDAKKIYMRVAYNAATKICTLYVRTNPTSPWIKLYTFSPFNSTKADFRGDWKLNSTTGKFSVILFGGSVNKINAGAVTIDDFVIKNSN